MVAAGLAARGRGPLPPQLWKWHIAGGPHWSEFDDADYRELIQIIILKNVFDAVQAFVSGHPSSEQLKEYSRLVGLGVVGKDVK